MLDPRTSPPVLARRFTLAWCGRRPWLLERCPRCRTDWERPADLKRQGGVCSDCHVDDICKATQCPTCGCGTFRGSYGINENFIVCADPWHGPVPEMYAAEGRVFTENPYGHEHDYVAGRCRICKRQEAKAA